MSSLKDIWVEKVVSDVKVKDISQGNMNSYGSNRNSNSANPNIVSKNVNLPKPPTLVSSLARSTPWALALAMTADSLSKQGAKSMEAYINAKYGEKAWKPGSEIYNSLPINSEPLQTTLPTPTTAPTSDTTPPTSDTTPSADSNSNPASNSSSSSSSSSTSSSNDDPVPPKETLPDVLKEANGSYEAIKNAIIGLQKSSATQQSTKGAIDTAYADSNYSLMLDIHKTLIDQNSLKQYDTQIKQIYADNNLSQFIDISQALRSSVVATNNVATALEDISVHLKAISEKETIINNNVEAKADIDIKPLTTQMQNLNDKFQDGVQIKRSEEETNLTKKQLDIATFETTEIQLSNMGDDIPKATPQKLRAIKDAVTAKKNSDENTFDLDTDDYDFLMDGLPNIESIFKLDSKSNRLDEVLQGL